MIRKLIYSILLIVVTAILTTIFQPLSFLEAVAQQSSCHMFSETGRMVCGKFLSFWQKNGALPIFGYPISNAFSEYSEAADDTYYVQYFQRAVLELHPNNKPPYDVQLSHTGTFQFNSKYPSGNALATYPVYPNAQVIKEEQATGSDRAFIMILLTKDKPDTVLAFYKQELGKQKWEFESPVDHRTLSAIYHEEDPKCNPNNPSKNPFVPCGRVYHLTVETIPVRDALTQITITPSSGTFCCMNMEESNGRNQDAHH